MHSSSSVGFPTNMAAFVPARASEFYDYLHSAAKHLPLLFMIVNIVLYSLVSIACFVTVAIGIRFAFLWLRDWLRWHKWLDIIREPISCEQFCEIGSLYYNASFFARIIKTIREKGLLV